MSEFNSSDDTSGSREARPEAGGLLHGEQNQGAERLTSPGGALGGKTDAQPGEDHGRTAGDASASAGISGAPAEAGQDTQGESKAAENKGEGKAPTSHQSEMVESKTALSRIMNEAY